MKDEFISQYVLIQRGVLTAAEHSNPPIALSDVHDYITRKQGATWKKIEPGHDVEVNKALAHMRQGVILDGNDQIYECYEYAGGIAIHHYGNPVMLELCNDIANHFGGELFIF